MQQTKHDEPEIKNSLLPVNTPTTIKIIVRIIITLK
jgi:hypothetical protein